MRVSKGSASSKPSSPAHGRSGEGFQGLRLFQTVVSCAGTAWWGFSRALHLPIRRLLHRDSLARVCKSSNVFRTVIGVARVWKKAIPSSSPSPLLQLRGTYHTPFSALKKQPSPNQRKLMMPGCATNSVNGCVFPPHPAPAAPQAAQPGAHLLCHSTTYVEKAKLTRNMLLELHAVQDHTFWCSVQSSFGMRREPLLPGISSGESFS